MTRHLSHGQSHMFALVIPAFGIPSHIEGKTGEIEADGTTRLYSELYNAGARAMTVQQNRNKRRARV